MVTRQELDQSEDVVYLVVDDLIARVDALPADEQVAFVGSLTTGQRMVWSTFLVDGEVNNGGFNQFFWNNSRADAAEARAGYLLIGATDHVALLDGAVARFDSNIEQLRPFHERGSLEAFSESTTDDVFADLDDKFFELDSHALITSYIRDHPGEFVDDPRRER